MPDWSPNWNDVRWDWGVAEDAIRHLRRAADLLEERTGERSRVAAEAQREWRGQYREEFDERLKEMVRRAREIADEFRHAADHISWASHRAWEEQQRRESARARWWDEKREEERLARIREEQGGGGGGSW